MRGKKTERIDQLSISSEILRIKNNIASSYTACEQKGAVIPQAKNSANLPAVINSMSGRESLSWHQCPQPVREYLAYVAEHPYSSGDNSYTYITDFAPATADQANSKPVGKTIDGVTFRDNEPNVAEPFSTASKAGTLTALDRLRWYNTTLGTPSGNEYSRGYNCRDLGGWQCDGGTVKYGMLVRSGELNPADRELMATKIGIKTEVNLLPVSVQAYQYSPWGIDWVGNPTDEDFMYRIDSGVKAQWKLYLRTIFESVSHGKPVVFHCGAGADKTGTMAVMLMGILGCREQDIDIDYELTTFSAYSNWRNRTYTGYVNYLNAIKAFPLVGGLSDSFRNRCVSFALSLGITISEINAFRSASISGTPDTLSVTLNSYTVTNTLSNVTTSNNSLTAAEYQGYEADIVPAPGYVIHSVAVTMNGADVTRSVFKGEKTNLIRAISYSLTGCTVQNARSSVIDGQMYYADIAANEGYTLENATVSITMGGTNVNNYYSNGKISIPDVTGNISITISAARTALENLFDPAESVDRGRIPGNGTPAAHADGQVVTNLIDASVGDVIYYSCDDVKNKNDYTGMMAFYTSGGSLLLRLSHLMTRTGGWRWASDLKSGYVQIPSSYDDGNGNITDLTGTSKIRICIPYININNVVVNRLDTPPVLD